MINVDESIPDDVMALARDLAASHASTPDDIADAMRDGRLDWSPKVTIAARAIMAERKWCAVHGPYGWLVMPDGLSEDSWYLSDVPEPGVPCEPLYSLRPLPTPPTALARARG